MTAADESRVVWRNEVRAALNELGVPGPGYPAPVANAVGILEGLLVRSEPDRNPPTVQEQMEWAHRSEPRAEWDRNRRDMQDAAFRLEDDAATPPAEGSADIEARIDDIVERYGGALTALGTPPTEGLDVERLARAITANWTLVRRKAYTDGGTPLNIARAIAREYAAPGAVGMSGDLRAAVEGLPLFPPPGLKIGPLVQVDRVLALIPEGAVLVTEADIIDALLDIHSWEAKTAQLEAAAILRHLREGT